MRKLSILNTREIKKIKEILFSQFSYNLSRNYAYLMNERNRLFIVNKDISHLNIDNLILDRYGLYFGELSGTELRLSKEGAQFVARTAKETKQKLSNIIPLIKEEIKSYFKGNDLPKELSNENRFVLLSYNHDIFGCAKYKNGTIINSLPKIYRGEVII
jgi:NOL1/NOP2/fmu family ribosome biogenesis protein